MVKMRVKQRCFMGAFLTLVLLSTISVGHVYADDEALVKICYLKIRNLGGGDDIENDLHVKGKVHLDENDDPIYVTLHVAGLDSDTHWSQTKKYDGGRHVKFEFLWYKVNAGDYAAWIVVEYDEGVICSGEPPVLLLKLFAV